MTVCNNSYVISWDVDYEDCTEALFLNNSADDQGSTANMCELDTTATACVQSSTSLLDATECLTLARDGSTQQCNPFSRTSANACINSSDSHLFVCKTIKTDLGQGWFYEADFTDDCSELETCDTSHFTTYVEDEDGNREDVEYPVMFCNQRVSERYTDEGEELPRPCEPGQVVFQEFADAVSSELGSPVEGAKCKFTSVSGSCATADDIGTCYYDEATQRLYVCELKDNSIYDAAESQYYLYPIALNYDYWAQNDSRFGSMYDPDFTGLDLDNTGTRTCQYIYDQTGACPTGKQIYDTSVLGDEMKLTYFTSTVVETDSGPESVPEFLCVRFGSSCVGVDAFQSPLDQVYTISNGQDTNEYPLDPYRWTVDITLDEDGDISNTEYNRTSDFIGYGTGIGGYSIDYDDDTSCNSSDQFSCNYTQNGMDPHPQVFLNQKMGFSNGKSDDELCKNGTIMPQTTLHFNLWNNDPNSENFGQTVPACSYGWVPVIDSTVPVKLEWSMRPCNKNNTDVFNNPVFAREYSPGANPASNFMTDNYPVFDTGIIMGDCNAENENACTYDDKYIYKCLATSKHSPLSERQTVVVPFD